MALIDLPQAKWGSGTGRQVIFKGDFSKIEEAILDTIPQVIDEVSSATPAPAVGVSGAPIQYNLTLLAVAAEFQVPTGTPVDGQRLTIRILSDGSARALTWISGAGGYIARGTALPNTTAPSTYLYVFLLYNAVADRWDCIGSS
jgi:hypothetical protein